MIGLLGGQLRVAGMGAVYGLDFGAALAMGQALGAPADLLAEVLPAVEQVLVRRANGDPENISDDLT